jgi:hypothetical protein
MIVFIVIQMRFALFNDLNIASPSIFLPFQTTSIGRSGLLKLTLSKDYAVKLTVNPQVLDR